MSTSIIKNQRAYDALVRGAARQHGEDLSRWPEDVREIVQLVCELWHLHAPATKNSKALWIRDARELADACGEFGLDAVRGYRETFELYMIEHQGVAMHTVSGPGSLVKMVRDTARQMREQGAALGSKRYITGKYAEFIEH
jgi:hypothetical protein